MGPKIESRCPVKSYRHGGWFVVLIHQRSIAILPEILLMSTRLQFKTAKECIQAIRRFSNPSIPQIQQTWNYIKQHKFKLDAIDYSQLLKHCHSPFHLALGNDILHHITLHLPHIRIDNILKTVMVNMLIKCGNPGKAVELWDDKLPADEIMYNSFVMACTKAGRLDIGKKIHSHMNHNRYAIHPTVLSSLSKLYSKCGEPEQVKHLWNLFSKSNFKPDAVFYTSIITACADWAKLNTAASSDALQLGKLVHNHITSSHIIWDSILYSSVMNMYVQCGRPQAALSIWQEMKTQVQLNHVSCVIALRACAETSSLHQGTQIHKIIDTMKIPLDTVLGNALINMYAKCGNVQDAHKVFLSMKSSNPDMALTTWNTIISAYSLQGDWETSYKLFNTLIESNHTPNEVTFTYLLTTASHAGKVKEALELYGTMHTYGVVPDSIHATIIVDVLSRSGKLQEAMDFIERNIQKPDILI